jgi:hypothetical protein
LGDLRVGEDKRDYPVPWMSAISPSPVPLVDPFAPVDLEALADDLRVLMRGPGAQAGQDMSRIGPALRAMCGIAASDHAADAIDAAAAWLRARAAALESDERILVLLAAGLHEAAPFRGARARLAVAANYLGRSELTARRHTAAALGVLARTTSPHESIPLQLRRSAGRWVRIGFVANESGAVVVVRCFLVAVSRVVDQPDKVYADVRLATSSGEVLAVPAVRVRHVSPAPQPERLGDHER